MKNTMQHVCNCGEASRNAEVTSDEGRLHTFVMDLLPITRQSARDHIGGHQGDQSRGDHNFRVPNKGASEYLLKAVVDFMSHGCRI